MDPFLHAKPIWHPEKRQINTTIMFTGNVSVTDPKECRLFLHVHCNYALYINQVFVSCGSFSDFPSYRVYDEIPLGQALNEGDNQFTLFAYDQGEDSFIYLDYPPEVIFSLWEGEEEIFLSAQGVPCCVYTPFLPDVPKISPQLSYSFELDMTKPLPPMMPAVETGETPLLFPRPTERLIIQDPAPSRVIAKGGVTSFVSQDYLALPPADVMQKAFRAYERPAKTLFLPSEEGISLPAGGLILDLQEERVGYFALDIDLPEDAVLLIGWGEHLADTHVRTKIGNRHFASRLRFTKGRHQFFYPLKRMGLRYLELHISSPCRLYYAGIRPSTYPLKELVEFHAEDHLHEAIYRTGIRTLLLCMHEHYEDCPWREQALYTMDSRNQMLMGYYAFHETVFAKASLKLISLSLREDHLLELISPGKSSVTIPSFSLVYLLQVYEYLKYSDDIGFVREILPVLNDIAEGFLARIDETGLVPRLMEDPEKGIFGKYWNFYEWQEGLDGHGEDQAVGKVLYDAPLNAFLAIALNSLSGIYLRLGDPKGSSEIREKFFALKESFHEAFYDSTRQLYASFLSMEKEEGHSLLASKERYHYAELTQALSVFGGLVPEEVLPPLLYHLAYDKDEDLIPITLSHSIFKYDALLSDPEHYGAFVFELVAQEYGKMLRQGATTFYETKEGSDAFDKAGSLCHGWSASPVYLYLKYLADVKNEGTKLPEELTRVHGVSLTKKEDPSPAIEAYY